LHSISTSAYKGVHLSKRRLPQMDVQAFISRCGDLVDNGGVLMATGGRLVQIALNWDGSILLKPNPDGLTLQQYRDGRDRGPVDYRAASELMLAVKAKSVKVHFDGMPDVDVLYALLDSGMCESVVYHLRGRNLRLFATHNAVTRQWITEGANRGRSLPGVFTTVTYTDTLFAERIMGG